MGCAFVKELYYFKVFYFIQTAFFPNLWFTINIAAHDSSIARPKHYAVSVNEMKHSR